MKNLIHKECKGVAMRYKEKRYISGEIPSSKDFEHVDGREMIPNERIKCDNCGKDIILIIEDDGFELSAISNK